MAKTRNHSEDRVAKDSQSKAAHDTKRRSSNARPTRSRKAMYWESVALMSMRCGLQKGRADLVDDGFSKEREQKHVFAMFYEQKRRGHRKCIAANEYLQFSHVK